MEESMSKQAASKKAVLAGWVLSLLAAAVFCMSASMKLSQNPKAVTMMSSLGWQPADLIPLAYLELTCVVLYLIPPIAVLGGIILTGYLGGAVATHLRLGQPVYLHVVIGLLIWGGLWLRESRLRRLVPLRLPS